jgi:hypothetical protein
VSNVADEQQAVPSDLQFTNPKAAAKAAKAYAKASRPWYKKKRFIVPIAAVALVVAISATSGGDSGGPTVTDPTTAKADTKAGNSGKEKAAPAETGEQQNPAKIGQSVELEGTRYTVNNVKTTNSVGSQFFNEKADGVFVVVNLTIENLKDESKIFMDSAAQFSATDGTKYSTDTDAGLAATEDDTLILTEMHPDLPTKGTLIFDVPQAKLKGGLLELSDLFGGGEAYVDLGL